MKHTSRPDTCLSHEGHRPVSCLLCCGRPRPCSRRVLAGLAAFVFRPDPLAYITTAILGQTPIPAQGASRGQYAIYFGYCPARAWLSYPTQPDSLPRLKPDRRNLPATGLQQCSCAVPKLGSRLRSLNLKRHDVWQHNFLSQVCKYRVFGTTFFRIIHASTSYDCCPTGFTAAGCCTNQCARRRRGGRLPAG